MKELNNTNYPNHIDQDGKPIVGSEWEIEGKTEIVTAVGTSKLFSEKWRIECEHHIDLFLRDFTPHISEPSLQERVKAKFEDDETEVVEVYSYSERSYLGREAGEPFLTDYISRVDCVGFVMHNKEEDLVEKWSTIIKDKNLVPIAVLLNKGGEA